MNEDVLEAEGRYRIRLLPDPDPMQPWGDAQSPMLRMEHRGGWWRAEHIDDSHRPRGDDSRIEEAAQRWGAPSADDWHLVEKYLKTFHGATQVEYWHSGDYWYVTYDSKAWREYSEAPPGSASLNEWRAWVEGDAWYWLTEEAVTWTTDAGFPDHDDWEPLDSCGGYLGFEYAREAALEHWASFMRDKREEKETPCKD